MALLDALLLRERRAIARAGMLAAAHRYDDALTELHDFESDRVAATREGLRAAAIDHFGAAAERAAGRSEGPRARARLDRARRYVTATLRPRLHRIEWRLRVQQLCHTRAEHLATLVAAAEAARAEIVAGTPPPEAWSRGGQSAIATAAALMGAEAITADDILYADDTSLRALRGAVMAAYPDDLAAAVPRLGHEFLRAVLLRQLHRPDLAALPMAECDDAEPLVCLEQARIAQLLGEPRVARTCLHGFAARAGGHRLVRRLHTGVFLAQLELTLGDEARALSVLEDVPVDLLGGRPALMYGRLLLDAGRAEEAQGLLSAIVARQPELEGAASLLAEAERLATRARAL